jgi:hypothetical protein
LGECEDFLGAVALLSFLVYGHVDLELRGMYVLGDVGLDAKQAKIIVERQGEDTGHYAQRERGNGLMLLGGGFGIPIKREGLNRVILRLSWRYRGA